MPHVEAGAIICLQEVSRKWAGRLHTLFASSDYVFTVSHYGRRFNGYMGVGLAYPRRDFALQEQHTVVVAEQKEWPRPPAPGLLGRAWGAATAIPRGVATGLCTGLTAATPSFLASAASAAASKCGCRRVASVFASEETPWEMAERRSNTLVFARLRHRVSGQRFAIGTYHMPCKFQVPAMMVIHAALVSQTMQRLSGDDPHVLAGDFNFKPHSQHLDPCYSLMTTGRVDPGHPAYPTPPGPWEPWRPVVEPMVSAYAAVLGHEPLYTNNVEVFCDTLDYIFCSKGVRPVAVVALPAEQGEPQPTPSEPSDHLLIGATVKIGGASRASLTASLATTESWDMGDNSSDEEPSSRHASTGVQRRRRSKSP